MGKDYNLLKDIHDIVNRMETKMDDRFEKLEAKTDKIEDRLSLLERFNSKAVGIVVAIQFLLVFAWDWIKVKILGH